MKKTLIIAEAGVNHNGDLELAKKLVDVAADAGVDYVKFQTFKAKELVSKSAEKASYQIQNTGKEKESQYEMLKKLELSEADHHELISHCKKNDINFLSTAFDLDSVDLLDRLGIDLFKVPSGEITNKPYLQKLASKKKPIILSTGMATKDEIQEALDVLMKAGIVETNIRVLHCNTEYPTPMNDVNLKAMLDIKNTFKLEVGYSDHTLGIEVPIAAVALGASVIEKHFTLDREMDGPDHRASLEPLELKAMVAAIRNIEAATGGSGFKKPTASELANKIVARKSLHSIKALEKNRVIEAEDLICLRPGDGMSPMKIDTIIGRKLKQDIPAYHKFTGKELE